ncbi:Lrp/AsnC family transcriptional regulator [Undibacterium curvum]|jgi:Lrp/AsnC family leucine-responsive transcriptional regulator|uniref:Lrp/AsnC family transcriptional regulator n=1 Tax=Undibacterium curvum TaxID=2762294 RepID=UPI003D14D3D2
MAKKQIYLLDRIDRHLLTLLNDNSRVSLKELAQHIGMSAPSTTERLRKLEDAGVLLGYRVEIDPVVLGYGLTAIVRIRQLPGQLQKVEALIREIPEFIECDKVTGEDCFIARLLLQDIGDLEPIMARISEYAETNTAIVKSTPVKRRLPPLHQ